MQLQRILTPGRQFIPQVDGLRFVAIAAVVLYHVNAYVLGRQVAGADIRPSEAWLPTLLGIGAYGVQLFFVISGFLLALPFARAKFGMAPRPSLRNYYLRRLTRLEPPYIVAMCAIFSAGILIHRISPDTATAWPHLSEWPNLVTSLLYQHNLIFGQPSAIASVAWSLEIEVQFYVLVPLLAMVFSLRNTTLRRALLVGIMVGSAFVRNLLLPHASIAGLTLAGQCEWFGGGFLFAR